MDVSYPRGYRRIILTDGWDGGNDFTKLQLVEDSGFTGGIEPNLADCRNEGYLRISRLTIRIPVEHASRNVAYEKRTEHTHFFFAEKARE